MKISLLQEELSRGLSTVSRAVASRNTTVPVLSNILLSTDSERLKLSATNLEIGINCWIGAKIETDGAITVPAKTFTDLVNILPPDRIDLELNARTQTLKLECSASKANIKGIDAQDFPVFSTSPDTEQVLVEPDVLKKMIDQVAFAAATDESRLMLTGVLVVFDDDSLTMSAADGFRTSTCSAQLSSTKRQALIPAKALLHLAKLLSGQEEPVQVSFTDNQVYFNLSNTNLVAQLIDLQFPDVDQIRPKRSDIEVIVSTSGLLKAFKAASVFARDAANTVKLSVGDGYLDIVARSDETGDNAARIDAEVSGEDLVIAFNIRYLMDWLNSVDMPQVKLGFTNASNPGLFVPVGNDDYVHVIMPMQIGR